MELSGQPSFNCSEVKSVEEASVKPAFLSVSGFLPSLGTGFSHPPEVFSSIPNEDFLVSRQASSRVFVLVRRK